MSKTLKVLICIAILLVGSIVTAVAVGVAAYIGANDTAAGYEARIVGEGNKYRTRLGTLEQTVLEIMQIDKADREAALEIVQATMQGRYGPNGSQAAFQMLTEANIPFNGANRAKAITALEAGRNHVQSSQEAMIAIVTDYNSILNRVWSGFWTRMAGWPKINLNDYKGVSTTRADEAFKAGVETAPIQIYQGK